MKITNPIARARITVWRDGSVKVVFELDANAMVCGKDLDDSMLIRSIQNIVTAPYLAVYPEHDEKDE